MPTALTKKVSDANPYRHPMRAKLDTLYTRFDREWVYIYTILDEVHLSCDKGFKINADKQAFIVPPGSRCTVSGKGQVVSKWWSNHENVYPRYVVATGNSYTFTATANRTLIPDYGASPAKAASSNRIATD